MIADKHVVGVTTNPTILASAPSKRDRYNEQLCRLGDEGSSVDDAVFPLTTDDVRDACACRRTLRALAATGDRLSAEDLDVLLERAERQSATLEELRSAMAARTMGSWPPAAR